MKRICESSWLKTIDQAAGSFASPATFGAAASSGCEATRKCDAPATQMTSVFSVVFEARFSEAQVTAFADALQLFELGYSWGGVTSLVVPFFQLPREHATPRDSGGVLVRFYVGLESTVDLLADLEQALGALAA